MKFQQASSSTKTSLLWQTWLSQPRKIAHGWVMYLSCIRTLPLKIAHQGTAPQKISCISGCCVIVPVQVAYRQLSPHQILFQASSYHRSIPPRYHYGKAKIDGISPCFVPLFCFKQCFPVIIYITKTEKWNNQQWVFASPKSTSWAPHLKKVQFPVSSVNDEKYPLPGIALVRFHPKARNAWKNFGRVMALWRDPSAPWE